ncbi:MAG: hypothetical protein OEV31_04630, partial [Gammaproteobacteria bacterium]|nr:hypothetical protein [Gammaproteobacteria bacterium]
MTTQPLTASEIEARLDESLDPGSARRADALAATLTSRTRADQEFVLRWVDAIAKTNGAMASLFAERAPEALDRLPLADIEEWVVRAMDIYDRMGLFPACAVFRDVAGFVSEARDRACGVALEDISGVLELFVRGLSGRALKLAAGEETYTDTTNLFLPARLSRLDDRDLNFRLYKAMVASQWAQTYYGSFREPLAETLRHYPDPARALRVFHALETIRLDAKLAQELTGLHRDMQALRRELGETLCPPSWEARLERLCAPRSDVRDTLALLPDFYNEELPVPVCYQGTLHPDQVAAVTEARLAREKDLLQQALLKMLGEQEDGEPPQREQEMKERFRFARSVNEELPGDFNIALLLDGKPVAPPDDVRQLMDSILQDLGDIPDEYLTAAGDGGYRRENSDEKRPEDAWKGTYHEEGAFLYHEWDFRRQHYRKHWAVLREVDVHPVDDAFVETTRRKYAGLIHGLRRTFEALRGEEKLF